MTRQNDDSHPRVFLDLPPEVAGTEDAAAVILPVPYDGTASWLEGAAGGPQAIVEASRYVEVWDIEISSEPWRHGIAMADPVEVAADPGTDSQAASQADSQTDPETLAQRVEGRVEEILARGQLPLVLGGEHSVTIGAVRAAAKRFGGLSVLQIDAHADTRESYRGSRYSHACVMARVREVCPTVQVGIRSADSAEIQGLDPERVFWAHDIARDKGQLVSGD